MSKGQGTSIAVRILSIFTVLVTALAALATAWLAWETRDLASGTQDNSRQLASIAGQLLSLTQESADLGSTVSAPPELLAISNCETVREDQTTLVVQSPHLCRNLQLSLLNRRAPRIVASPLLNFTIEQQQGVCHAREEVVIAPNSEANIFFNIRSCLDTVLGETIRTPVRFTYVPRIIY